jgi:hypothetical protein
MALPITDKYILNLIKKLTGKNAANPKKNQLTEKMYEENIRQVPADNIFREMKKLPFSE